MYDNGSTLTMISQKRIIHDTLWNEEGDVTKGSVTVLTQLEKATSGWSNVENQTYTMGSTNFNGTGQYTGRGKEDCTSNTYTLPERTAKARLLLIQKH